MHRTGIYRAIVISRYFIVFTAFNRFYSATISILSMTASVTIIFSNFVFRFKKHATYWAVTFFNISYFWMHRTNIDRTAIIFRYLVVLIVFDRIYLITIISIRSMTMRMTIFMVVGFSNLVFRFKKHATYWAVTFFNISYFWMHRTNIDRTAIIFRYFIVLTTFDRFFIGNMFHKTTP